MYRSVKSVTLAVPRLLLIAAGSFVLGSSLLAATSPPPFPFDSINPTLDSKPVTRLLMGRFVVSLEISSLPKVEEVIGLGSLSYRGDGAEATAWLCYTLDESLPHQRLWIMSNAEMGGPERLVDGIAAEVSGGGPATPDCPSLPKRFLPLSFDHAIWLDTKESSVRSTLGSPSKVGGKCSGYTSVCSAISSASSTSIPRYRMELSSLLWPSSS